MAVWYYGTMRLSKNAMRIVPTKDDIDDDDRMTKVDGDEDEGGGDGDTDEDDIDDDDGISARATSHEG